MTPVCSQRMASNNAIDEMVLSRQYPDPVYAFGKAVNLLRRVAPFSAYGFGKLSGVLMGQIRCGHYVFTVAEENAVGYVGWAMCDAQIAQAWIDGKYVPSFDECVDGDSWVGIIYYAASRAVCFFQARYCRNVYPNKKAFGIRD